MASIRAALLIFATTALRECREEQASVATSATTEVGESSFPAEVIDVRFDGRRRLVFVVGVREYQEATVDLERPLNDGSRRDLLTGPIFRFPKPNVCVPLTNQATTAAFKGALEELISKARAEDVACRLPCRTWLHAKDKNGTSRTTEMRGSCCVIRS